MNTSTEPLEDELAKRRASIEAMLRTRFAWFNDRYDVVAQHSFVPDSEHVFLGHKSTGRTCRYCGKAAPSVKFSKLAHAIPDQVGNNWLFDHEECDSCNEHFSKHVEDDFAKWTLPWRSMGRIPGKGGVPSLKSNDKKFRVDAVNQEAATAGDAPADNRQRLAIRAPVDAPRHVVDESKQNITFTLERQPYVPMGVFKCLVKMALALMPAQEAQRCAHLKKWVLETQHTFESFPYAPLNVLHQLISGPLPNDGLSCWLLRRKPAYSESCPHMQFVLDLGNHLFQIVLPFPFEDRPLIEAGTITTHLWPSFRADVEHHLTYGRGPSKVHDLSGFQKVRNETIELTFHYDSIVATKPEAAVQDIPGGGSTQGAA